MNELLRNLVKKYRTTVMWGSIIGLCASILLLVAMTDWKGTEDTRYLIPIGLMCVFSALIGVSTLYVEDEYKPESVRGEYKVSELKKGDIIDIFEAPVAVNNNEFVVTAYYRVWDKYITLFVFPEDFVGGEFPQGAGDYEVVYVEGIEEEVLKLQLIEEEEERQ